MRTEVEEEWSMKWAASVRTQVRVRTMLRQKWLTPAGLDSFGGDTTKRQGRFGNPRITSREGLGLPLQLCGVPLETSMVCSEKGFCRMSTGNDGAT